MKLHTNRLIDHSVEFLEDMQSYFKEIPRGTYITKGSKYYDIYMKYRNSESKFDLISDIIGVSPAGLISIARIARKWYERCKWERCLPDEAAWELVEYYVEIEAAERLRWAYYYSSTGRVVNT